MEIYPVHILPQNQKEKGKKKIIKNFSIFRTIIIYLFILHCDLLPSIFSLLLTHLDFGKLALSIKIMSQCKKNK